MNGSLLKNAVGDGDGGNTIGKLASRVQFNRSFVNEEPRDQKTHILE
jgi:hypothetical protein